MPPSAPDITRTSEPPENRFNSSIALHTPVSVHYGTATEIRSQRQATLSAAYAANPIRIRHRPPAAPEIPEVAWINQPMREEAAQNS